MVRYVLQRLVAAYAVVVLVTAVTWLIIHTTRAENFAGDPRPLLQQLLEYLRDVFLRFDLGNSFEGSRAPVVDIIREGVTWDIALLAGSLVLGMAGGVAGGVYCASHPGTAGARLLETLAMAFFCAPVYVVGLAVLLLFGSEIGYVLQVVPLRYTDLEESPTGWLGSLIVPCVVLALPIAAMCLRMLRASLTEVLGEEYMRTAVGKGLARGAALRRHGTRAALGPTLSLIGVTVPPLLVTNLVLVESVFSLPGVFQSLPEAMEDGDFPVLQGQTLVAAALVGATTLIVDAALAWADPRVRRQPSGC